MIFYDTVWGKQLDTFRINCQIHPTIFLIVIHIDRIEYPLCEKV